MQVATGNFNPGTPMLATTLTASFQLRAWQALALACLVTAAHAQAPASPVLARGQLNLGYRVDAAPFSVKTAAGQPAGYMVAMCQRIAERLKTPAGRPLRVNPIEVPPDQVNRYLQGGSVDVLCAATTDTPERRAVMAFSHPLFVAQIKVLVRKVDGLKSVADLKGQPVVVIGRSTADDLATSRAGELQWKTARALDAIAAMGQVELGWVKGYARDDVLLLTQLAQGRNPTAYQLLPEALSREPIAIAVRKDDPVLLAEVNAAIAEVVKDGSMEKSYRQWFMEPIEPFKRAVNLPPSAELQAEWAKLR